MTPSPPLLDYTLTGRRGAQPVLFLHGITGSRRYFQRKVRRLAERWQLVLPDLPGFGRSPKPRVEYTISFYRDAVRRTIEAAGLDRRPMHIVAHSLGGLASRAYIHGIGLNRKGETMAYGGDVAALIMISTPNQGSVLANISGRPGAESCVLADTANLRDLQPSSDLLAQLNRQAWPAGTAVHSIISNNQGRNSDDVVTIESQDLNALAAYRTLPDASRWLQTFQRDGILHLRVHNEATTVALFSGIITDVDNSTVRAARSNRAVQQTPPAYLQTMSPSSIARPIRAPAPAPMMVPSTFDSPGAMIVPSTAPDMPPMMSPVVPSSRLQ